MFTTESILKRYYLEKAAAAYIRRAGWQYSSVGGGGSTTVPAVCLFLTWWWPHGDSFHKNSLMCAFCFTLFSVLLGLWQSFTERKNVGKKSNLSYGASCMSPGISSYFSASNHNLKIWDFFPHNAEQIITSFWKFQILKEKYIILSN